MVVIGVVDDLFAHNMFAHRRLTSSSSGFVLFLGKDQVLGYVYHEKMPSH